LSEAGVFVRTSLPEAPVKACQAILTARPLGERELPCIGKGRSLANMSPFLVAI
jgi:hypothetical protein